MPREDGGSGKVGKASASAGGCASRTPGTPAWSGKTLSRVPALCGSLRWASPGCSVQSHSSTTSGGRVPATSSACPPCGPRHSTGA